MPSRNGTKLDDGASTAKNQIIPRAMTGCDRRIRTASAITTRIPKAASAASGSTTLVTRWTECIIDCPNGHRSSLTYRHTTIACVSAFRIAVETPANEILSIDNRYRPTMANATIIGTHTRQKRRVRRSSGPGRRSQSYARKTIGNAIAVSFEARARTPDAIPSAALTQLSATIARREYSRALRKNTAHKSSDRPDT